MKTKIQKIVELAASSASLAGRGVASAQRASTIVGSAALSAGKFAKNATSDFVKHEDTKAVVLKVKELASTAKGEAIHIAASATDHARDMATSTAIGAKRLSNHIVASAKKADQNHKEIAAKTDTVSMGLGIVAGVAVAGAKLTAIPMVIAASPAIGGVATVIGVVAGSAHFYSKWKTKKSMEKSEGNGGVETAGPVSSDSANHQSDPIENPGRIKAT